MQITKTNKGIILTEALIAITLLLTASMVMISIMMNAYSTIRISRDYLSVQNIATEAIEIIKNIRSTNWLTEPNNADCWIRLDPMYECRVTANYPRLKRHYIVTPNKNDQWSFQASPGANLLNLEKYSTGMELFRLYFDGSAFTHNKITGGETPYYRAVEFVDITNMNDYIVLKVIIQWRESGLIRTVERTFTMHNYVYQ